MIQHRYVVHRTRRVRDLLRRKKFVAAKRMPGGREIEIGKAETRRRALEQARYAARPNGSPTAGGSYTPGYTPGSEGGGGSWGANRLQDVLLQ